MSKKCFLVAGLLVIALALPTVDTFGQAVYGSIIGTVTDSTGAVVPKAKVTITDVGKAISYETATNDSGNYEQTHLIVGKYRVRVEAQGFQAYVQENVQVNVDAATRVDPKLQVGSVTQTVNVTAELPLLKTERSDVATTFSEKEVKDLPLFNRNFTDLELLTPGTQLLGWQHASSENPQGSRQIMVNGQHFSGTSFQLDGTDNRDPILGIIVINPNLDSVTEAKITSQNYDAEFGQAMAGVVTAQTKTGTNALHGSAFYFRRDNNTTARDPFAQSVPIPNSGRFIPPTLWNQFGASAGGPIKKDKTFIFGDYQGTRQSSGGSTLTRVPTLAERGGDLSDLGVDIFDPSSSANPATRTQFMGNSGTTPNVIPTSQLSQPALNILKDIPMPDIPNAVGPGPNYSASGIEIFDNHTFDVRADHYYSEKTHIFGRYSLGRYIKSAPGAFGVLAGGPDLGFAFAGQSHVLNQSIASGFDYTLRPDWLTDFRFGFFRYRVFVNPGGLGTSPAADALIPGLNLDKDFTSGMPAFFINGVGGFSFGYALGVNQCNCPLNQQEQQFQWVNNWTHILGNHTIKFGEDIRYAMQLRVPSDTHRAGELSFNPAQTEGFKGGSIEGGTGLAAFLLGGVGNFGRYVSTATDAAERQRRWFFYGQDTWRITTKLTFSYGLRWEIISPQYVNGPGKGAWLDQKTGEILVAGSRGVGLNGNVANNFRNFAPRLGIAYQARSNTVIRMGYGRSFDIGTFGSVFGHTVTQTVPVLASQSLNPASNFQSVFNLAQGPPALNPNTILQNNCLVADGSAPNPITNPNGTLTQCLGANGRPLLPDGIFSFGNLRRMMLPTVDAWNATVQHQLTSTIALEVAYVGNKGTHVFVGDGPQQNSNTPTIVGYNTVGNASCPAPCTILREPFYPKFGWTQGIGDNSLIGNNDYNSLQVKLEKRFSQHYSLLAHYSWAAAHDYDSDYYTVNPTIDYGPTNWQRASVFVVDNIWDLPFGRGRKYLGNPSKWVNGLVDGWQLNSAWTWESGLPFTPSYNECGGDIDTGPCRVTKIGNVATPHTATQWYQPATAPLATNGAISGPWERPQVGTFGLAGRNSMRGPRLFDTDLSLFKNFQVTEKLKGQFRIEAFNGFNIVPLGQPDNTVDDGTGGQIFGVNNFLFPLSPTPMRQVQFGLRFDF
jgi:hypothetical protein